MKYRLKYTEKVKESFTAWAHDSEDNLRVVHGMSLTVTSSVMSVVVSFQHKALQEFSAVSFLNRRPSSIENLGKN